LRAELDTGGQAALGLGVKGDIAMGKRGLGIWVTVGFLLVLSANALAGATCMPFLKISTLPRIAAMGDASVAVRDATWAEGNPAHLTQVEGSLITFSHTGWFEDVALETLTFGTSSPKHALGASVIGLHTDPLEGYDAVGVRQGTFRFYDLVISGSYATRVHPAFSLGASGKVLYEKIDWDSATDYAFDLGCGYAPLQAILGGRLGAGLVLRDLGPRMGYSNESFDLPLTVQGGLSYQPLYLPAELSAVVAVDYQKTREQDGGVLLGLEVGLRDMVAARLGYRGNYKNGKLTFGVGLSLANTVIDYAYADVGDDLGGTHRVSLALKTGSIFPSPEASR
jgi:hypothetical protein